MASGDRRMGSSVRRGMTVLGKIPAVPKPINLPSQRLENRGLDPSVEIVPRGTFNWGSGRSPPTTSSSWVSAGLSSSSPPVGSGAWSTTATNSPAPSSINSSGTDNQSRPMSAGNARPSSAGASRPLSASTTTGRAWGNATKLEEQSQPGRFNLTNADFPTLGSEKELNWQPLQHATTSNRPTSADATKERQLIYASHYKSVGDRPTSADATKERKPVYPGTPHVDRPISADGTHPDKGIQQPASRLPSCPPVADGTMPDQRRLFYPGLSRHGIAGPGPGPGPGPGLGTYDGPKENVTRYPVPVQQTITVPNKEFLFPGVSLHDVHFNRPGGTHADDVVVLPVDGGPEVYGSYAFDMRPTNQSTTPIDHHPRATWGPHYLERSGYPEGQFVQPGPSEPFHVMNPSNHRMETAVLHEPAVGNRRDGFGVVEEHRSGWAGPNLVYISPVDAREPLTAGRQKFVRPEMLLSSWGRQPMPTGWSNVHGGSLTVGTYQEMPSPVNYHHAPLIEAMGPAVEVVKNSEKQMTCSDDEVAHSIALQGQQTAAPGNDHTHGRKDAQGPKHKETVKISTAITSNNVPDILRGNNHVETIGGTLPGTQPIKTMQKDKETKAEQNKESLLLLGAMPKMASQSQENTTDEDFQGFRQDHFTVKDSKNVSHEDKKSILKKKNPSLQNSSKATKESDPLEHEEEKGISILKALKGNSLSSSILSSADLITTAGKEIKSNTKDACPEGSSKTSEKSTLNSSPKESKSSASNFVASVEEEKIPLDDGSRTKRNLHSVRRAQGRSIHEPHPVDRQHVNHGLVWTPKPVSGGIARDEVQLSTGDDSDLHKSFSSTDGKKRETQPLGEHEAHEEIHVQQMPLAASNQQGQAHQGQELSVGSNRRPSQPVQQHRSEHSHKKQGPKVQHHNLSEQSMQYEEVTPLTSKKESSHIKSQQSSSNMEFQSSQSQVSQREANRRESQPKQYTEDGEQGGAGIVIPVLAKSESKNYSGVYSQKTSRNQHRYQQHEQEHETINHDHVQRFFSKEEKPGAEDIDNPAREAAILSAFELKKSRKDVKSGSSRNGKQRKGDPFESGADRDLEGHVFRGDRYQWEAGGERPGLSLPVEVKGPKDKEEKAHNQKVSRKHDMQTKQSATVSRQEYRYIGEDLMADTLNSEPIARAEKRYVPKQITKHYLQQELEAPGMHGPARQRRAIQETSLPTGKVKDDNTGPQSSPQSLGTQTTAKKRDMVRYTPLPARKKPIEGQQCMAASQSGHGSVDLKEVQAVGASFSHADSDRTCTAESADKGFDLRSSVMEHRDSNKVCELFEPFQSKKDAKHYVAKSSCKQESPSNFDEEALLKGTKLQRSHCVSTSDSAKRKEGVKPYGAKDDHAKQKEFSVGSERKTTKETGTLPMPEQNDLVGNQKQEKITVSDHFHKNHLMKAAKSTSLNRSSSQRNLPPSEYRNNSLPVTEGIIHDLRVEETNDSTKDYKQDDYSSSSQKIDSRQGSIEVGENLSHDDVDMAKPRQNQRRRYQYQPVVQHLQIGKPQVAASSTYRSNNRPTEQGYSRYERAEGPRRGQGQAYYYRATEHTDSNNV